MKKIKSKKYLKFRESYKRKNKNWILVIWLIRHTTTKSEKMQISKKKKKYLRRDIWPSLQRTAQKVLIHSDRNENRFYTNTGEDIRKMLAATVFNIFIRAAGVYNWPEMR